MRWHERRSTAASASPSRWRGIRTGSGRSSRADPGASSGRGCGRPAGQAGTSSNNDLSRVRAALVEGRESCTRRFRHVENPCLPRLSPPRKSPRRKPLRFVPRAYNGRPRSATSSRRSIAAERDLKQSKVAASLPIQLKELEPVQTRLDEKRPATRSGKSRTRRCNGAKSSRETVVSSLSAGPQIAPSSPHTLPRRA